MEGKRDFVPLIGHIGSRGRPWHNIVDWSHTTAGLHVEENGLLAEFRAGAHDEVAAVQAGGAGAHEEGDTVGSNVRQAVGDAAVMAVAACNGETVRSDGGGLRGDGSRDRGAPDRPV